MKNNTFSELAEVINRNNLIYLYPHIHGDGDALGSCAALCHMLRENGKEAYIIIEDQVAKNLLFLDNNYTCMISNKLEAPDLSIAIDCSGEDRFPLREKLFKSAKETMCIDHHKTGVTMWQYNYIDSTAAATGELIYKLFITLGYKIDKEAGEAIFTALTTDTGNFQYSNTTKTTHEIAAALYDLGIDGNKCSLELYENVSLNKIIIENKVLGTIKLYGNGKLAVAYVTQEMLKDANADMSETEGVVARLRSISGVDTALFIKEYDKDVIKVSMRSKAIADVSKIAAEFGGGGHVRAAGCTINDSLEAATNKLVEKILEELGEKC